jgi:23S rRNA pseudouridine2605 synthase
VDVRLQKFLAEAGVASRRAAERLIADGQVTVNGEIVRQLGTKVDPARDRVAVEGRIVRARRKVYVALHKPRGYVSTRSDPEGRSTVRDLLPAEWQHLFHVGRLDRDSEGLIFLTNDGEFALRLTHPRYEIRKTYLVTIEGRAERALLAQCIDGVRHQGESLKAQSARLLSANNTRSVLELELAEGKNREVRRLLSVLGLRVQRLQRVRIGPIRLGELPAGKWRTLTETEIKSLLPPV